MELTHTNGTSTNGTHEPVTENVQLIDFLLLHMKTMTAIADAVGYSDGTLHNIYYGKSAGREGFTLMLRQLATDTMLQAAKDGTLVRIEPEPVRNDKKKIEEITRRVLAEINRAA